MPHVQDAILIDVSSSAVFGRKDEQTRGGADTSLENNNVYSVEPKVYVEAECASLLWQRAERSFAAGPRSWNVDSLACQDLASCSKTISLQLQCFACIGPHALQLPLDDLRPTPLSLSAAIELVSSCPRS